MLILTSDENDINDDTAVTVRRRVEFQPSLARAHRSHALRPCVAFRERSSSLYGYRPSSHQFVLSCVYLIHIISLMSHVPQSDSCLQIWPSDSTLCFR